MSLLHIILIVLGVTVIGAGFWSKTFARIGTGEPIPKTQGRKTFVIGGVLFIAVVEIVFAAARYLH